MTLWPRLRGAPVRPAAVVLLATLMPATVVLAACTNQEASVNRRPHEGTTTAAVVNGVQQVSLHVDDRFRFDPSTVVVHRGRVTVTLVHAGTGAPHDFQVVGFPGDFVPLTAAGSTRSATFDAPSPGRYRFVCTIHEKQGQTGTLIVLAE